LDPHPRPPDADAVALPADLLALTELLARHTHDAWARRRLADGWRHGPRRDDATKEHPGLVPYDELPESEKEYDRATALGVLRTLVALGYRIEGPGTVRRGRRVKRD
jgi:RyR domain